jgi:CBS domain-containing protein
MSDPISRVLERKGYEVFLIDENETVAHAVARMNEHGIGALLVGTLAAPCGIFSERDVLVRVIGQGRDPAKTVVGDVMSRDLITVRPETTTDEAMALVTEHRCRHLPVLGDSGICGMISSGDVTSWLVHCQRQTIDDLTMYIRAS